MPPLLTTYLPIAGLGAAMLGLLALAATPVDWPLPVACIAAGLLLALACAPFSEH